MNLRIASQIRPGISQGPACIILGLQNAMACDLTWWQEKRMRAQARAARIGALYYSCNRYAGEENSSARARKNL